MSELTIITNNVPRDVIEAYELDERERAEFDYLNWAAIDRGEDSASFVRYKGQLYDLGEVVRTDVEGWDGIVNDSFFSGVLFRYARDEFDPNTIDPEHIVCGRYYS